MKNQNEKTSSIDKINGTKEKIENTALELFSRKGYEAVSIRDICKIVGIKESTIYYHFKNKQAIMDSLIEKVNEIIEMMQNHFNTEFAKTGHVSEGDMCEVAAGILDHYLLHPYVYQMISVLSIERMSDEKADVHYRKLLFDLPFIQQKRVFQEMMERGYIREADAEVLAREYQSVIYYAFQKNCIGTLITDERKEIARKEIRENILDAYRKMR